jgi:uncharacterized membrane protein
MGVLTILRVVAIGSAGLLAGIYFGDRAGAYYARAELSDSSVVQFQQVVHVHYVRFMPPLVLTALLAGLGWLFMVRSQWRSPEFWLIAVSVCGIVVIAVLTRSVNVPLNNALMTWNIAAPPADFRKLWAPWETVNTIRAFVATGVLLLEAVALSLRASPRRRSA